MSDEFDYLKYIFQISLIRLNIFSITLIALWINWRKILQFLQLFYTAMRCNYRKKVIFWMKYLKLVRLTWNSDVFLLPETLCSTGFIQSGAKRAICKNVRESKGMSGKVKEFQTGQGESYFLISQGKFWLLWNYFLCIQTKKTNTNYLWIIVDQNVTREKKFLAWSYISINLESGKI